MPGKGLSLYEFSDRELMHLVRELCDESEDGYVTAEEVQKKIRLSSKNPHSNIGTRFAWMKTYGILDHDQKGWKLTPIGEKIRTMKLSTSAQNAIAKLPPEAGMEAMLALGDVYTGIGNGGSPSYKMMMRRAWRFKSGARS